MACWSGSRNLDSYPLFKIKINNDFWTFFGYFFFIGNKSFIDSKSAMRLRL